MKRLVLMALCLALVTVAAPASATTARAFRLSETGMVRDCEGGHFQQRSFTGVGSHLRSRTLTFSMGFTFGTSATPPSSSSALVLTEPHGDQMFGTIAVNLDFGSQPSPLDSAVTLAGGTGRFVTATGSATMTVTLGAKADPPPSFQGVACDDFLGSTVTLVGYDSRPVR